MVKRRGARDDPSTRRQGHEQFSWQALAQLARTAPGGRGRGGAAGRRAVAPDAACVRAGAGRRPRQRLHQLTDHRAKPALPFAGKLNIIDFALSNCVNSGIRRIGVLTQYKAQSLIRHIERGWGFLQSSLGEFIDIVPAQQQHGDGWYSGTANAVWQNLEHRARGPPAHWCWYWPATMSTRWTTRVLIAEHVACRRRR
jgi:hypothetical protein